MGHSEPQHDLTTVSDAEIGTKSEKVASDNVEADRSSNGSKSNELQESSEKKGDQLEVRNSTNVLLRLS
jgi:hypothetical protein